MDHDPCGAQVVASLRLDPTGRILAVDGAAAELLAIAPEALVGEPLASRLDAPDRARTARLLAQVAGGPPQRLRAELVRGDGQPLVAELVLAAVGEEIVALLHDVGPRRLDERLRAIDEALIAAFGRGDTSAQALERLLAALTTAIGATSASAWTRGRAPDEAAERLAHWPRHDSPVLDTDCAALAERALASGVSERGGNPEWIAVPLLRDGGPTGAILLELGDARADASTRRALERTGARVGELFGMLEERHSRIASLARLALTDELTGLPNRRAWQETLARELARAARSGVQVCIAILDLDGFKAYNDTHGHLAGDRLLREAAAAWQRELRLSDLLARYGGEEFAAVIPAWPLQTAVTVVERVRRATPGGLTASAGVASWDRAETGAELFGRADAALYAAKQAGRNRTASAREPTRDDGAPLPEAAPISPPASPAPARLPRAS